MTQQPAPRRATRATPDAVALATDPAAIDTLPDPDTDRIEAGSLAAKILTAVFVFTPLLALVVGLPLALASILPVTWLDVALGLILYSVTALGITVGFHRLFTHRSFKATAPTRWFFGIAGSMAIEGSIKDWVADHRKHHMYSDKEGDPHSPWRFGPSAKQVARGLWHAHMGWFFAPDGTDVDKYAPDITKDPISSRLSRWFPALVAVTLIGPGVIAGLITWSWVGALSGFFWAGLVRVALVHQVTWSINSICHVWGKRPFKSREQSGNVAWLAIPSFGESWHNYHHADPTAARHGVLRHQIDLSAVLIKGLEKTGQASAVRWPSQDRVMSKLVTAPAAHDEAAAKRAGFSQDAMPAVSRSQRQE